MKYAVNSRLFFYVSFTSLYKQIVKKTPLVKIALEDKITYVSKTINGTFQIKNHLDLTN